MSSDISQALLTLENQIGQKSQSGYEFVFSDDKTRKLIISWLTIKGLLTIGSSTNNSTLGKLYGLPGYFSAAMENQRSGKNKYQKRISPLSFSTKTPEDNYVFPFPKNEEEAAATYPPSNLSSEELTRDPFDTLDSSQIKPLVESIVKEVIHITLTQELTKNRSEWKLENENQNRNFITNITQTITEQLNKNHITTKDIATDTAEKIINNKIKIENEKIKKLVEDVIFQSYLNYKIASQPKEKKQKEQEQNNIDENLDNFIPKIDPNYHFDPYATKVIRSALSMSENLYVYGDTGCGKTTHLEQVCSVLNRGIIRINPHDGITREMFLGGMKLINNETIFVEGALPFAMRNGLVFLVDEISFLPPNLTAILNPIGEKGGKLYISETSEWLSPSPGFCIFATDNTGGKGDRTGNYTGTEVQNTATLDRFAFCLKMDYLPQEKEKEMLTNRFPNQNPIEIEKMLSLARDIRSAFSRGELSLTLSTRKLIKFFDQRNNNFTTQEALSNTILSWLDEDDETLVKTMIDRLQILEITPETKTLTTNLDMFQQCIDHKAITSTIRIYRLVHNPIDLRIAKERVEAIMRGEIDMELEKQNPRWFEPYTGAI